MEYELRMAEKNKAIGINIAQNGIFVFLWWVEFALVWKASRPTKREPDVCNVTVGVGIGE